MYIRFASATAFAAAISMGATPLSAAELPNLALPVSVEATGVFDADSVNADQYRRWHRRNRVDAGDVIGGLLVIGTIAAVASAASRANQRNGDYRYPERDYRTRGYPYPGPDYRYDYRSRPYDSRMDDSLGLDRAVDMCAREVERNARIETVDSANRTANGWDVAGRLRTGEPFRCTIGNDGRIDDVDYGRGTGYRGEAGGIPSPADGQWDDDRYAAARAAQNAGGEPVPAYPGGPLPGEDATSDDGRYETAQAPDFEQ